jgi:serine phosphatase RsbU (regulator of sigma subunit)
MIRRFWLKVLLPAFIPLALAALGKSLIPNSSFNLTASGFVLLTVWLYLRLLQRYWEETGDLAAEIHRFRRLVWLTPILLVLNLCLQYLADLSLSSTLSIWISLPVFSTILFILLTLLLQLLRLSPEVWHKRGIIILGAGTAVLGLIISQIVGIQFLIFFLLGAWILRFEECSQFPRREKLKLALGCLISIIFIAVGSSTKWSASTPSPTADEADLATSFLSHITPLLSTILATLRHLLQALLILLPLKLLLHPVADWLRTSLRIRTKLMISYLFSSIIPMLLLAILLLCGYLFTIGSYYQRFITQLISTRASSLLDRMDLSSGISPIMPGNRLVERMREEGISAVLFDVGHADKSGSTAYFVQTPFPQFHLADTLLNNLGAERFNGLMMVDSAYYMTQWAASGEWVIGVFREFTLEDLLLLRSQCGMDLAVHPHGDVKIRIGGVQRVEFTTASSPTGKVLRTDTVSGSSPGLHLVSLPILVPGLVFNNENSMVRSNVLFTIRISPKTLFANLFSSESIINRTYLILFAALAIILGAILVLVAMIGFGLAGGITRSISLLRKGTYQISQGNLNARIYIKSRDELGQLAGSFNAMVADLSRMLVEIKDKERMEGELEAARAIQLKLLPQVPPEIAGYLVAATSLPAKQVGGDYYDFLPEPAGRTSVAVGDVCGKGMPAALLMANLQASLHTLSESGLTAQELITRLNRVLYANTDPQIFVTFFFGVLDPASGEFAFVNAGHNPPILCGNDRLEQLTAGGLPLGIMADSTYSSGQIGLEPGEMVVLYSDGIVEAADAQEVEFGEARFIKLLQDHSQEDPQTIQQIVLREVAEYCGTPQDDVTLVILKRMANFQ